MKIPLCDINKNFLIVVYDQENFIVKVLVTLFLVLSISTNTTAQKSDSNMIPDHFNAWANKFPKWCMVSGSEYKKAVALTFDDGPSEVTIQVMDLLEKYHVKATFFWQGNNLSEHQTLVRRAIKQGHEFGNHSWNHSNGYEFDTTKLWEEQVMPTLLLYDSLFELKVNLYRPPFGGISAEQIQFLSEKHISTVLWSLSTFDWDVARNSSDEIQDRFEKNVSPGSIVLLHDVDFNNTFGEMLAGLEGIIKYGKSMGYGFVTISELKMNQ